MNKTTKSLSSLLKPYRYSIIFLILFSILSNALSLGIPLVTARAIDAYNTHTFAIKSVIVQFITISIGIFITTIVQQIIQTITAERVARDTRSQLMHKISQQTYAYIQEKNPSTLLTNVTSDIDNIKQFISLAIPTIVSSVCIIIGASSLLLYLDFVLGATVLLILPIIITTFVIIFSKIRVLFKEAQEVIDWLNKIINDSILGAAIIRVLNAQIPEYNKFLEANLKSKTIGLRTLRLFASLIPVITFVSNLAIITIVALGGYFVIHDSMTLGTLTAFNSYIAILIFPIIIIGFMSNIIAAASASYKRIADVLESAVINEYGNNMNMLQGSIEAQSIYLTIHEKTILKDIHFTIKAGKKTAIIGPTGSGKTQLFYILAGLIPATRGNILFDGIHMSTYDLTSLHAQIGYVFENSIIFNMSIHDNITFGGKVSDIAFSKAIETAELQDFVDALPNGINTNISERGTNLSGGQKQRIMLARALALEPKILLLDDFTARVDTQTEQKIIKNISQNYPNITIVSISQKISSIEDYDSIIVLMEGELIAQGTHIELLQTSPEYMQIVSSQQSTN